MATQDKTRIHRGHRAKVVELHVPGKNREQSRFHVVKRRVRNAPWWLWAATVLILIVAAFMSGAARSDGRSSVYAELLAEAEARLEQLQSDNAVLVSEQAELTEEVNQLANRRQQLSDRLAESVPAAELAALRAEYESLGDQLAQSVTQLEAVETELTQLRPQLEAANARIVRLEETVLPSLQSRLQAQQARADRLQATLTAQQRALPGRIAAQLNASSPIETAQYKIAVSQTILRESFGIRFGPINDETLAVTALGTASFGLAERPVTASPSGAIRIGLPRLASTGLSDLNFSYDMGFLARIGDQDVTDLIAWVEEHQLLPKACGDTSSLRELVAQTEQQIKLAAGSTGIKVVWTDSDGREFSSSELTDTALLSEAC